MSDLEVHPDPDVYSPHSFYSPVHSLSKIPDSASKYASPTDGVVICSFQQLLRQADSGFLFSSYANEQIYPDLHTPKSPIGLKSDQRVCSPEQVSTPGSVDDGYSGGSESEESEESEAEDAILSHQSPMCPETNEVTCSDNDDTIVSFFDPIGKDEFMAGRDVDSSDFGDYVDDTDVDDVPLVRSSFDSIHQSVHHSSDKDIDTAVASNTIIEEVPALGCAADVVSTTPVPSYEICSRNQDAAKKGFLQRQRAVKKVSIPIDSSHRNMGAIEIAVERAKHRIGEHVFEPVIGMVFDTYEECYDFYNLYSWEVGFGIIYNHNSTRSNDKSYRTMQEFTCQKGGVENRAVNSSRKVKCKARIKLLRTEDERWYIRDFVKDHNHPLSKSCCEKREWKSHKRIDPYSLNVIQKLRMNNVDQTKIRCVIGSLFGSLKDSPCTKRSLRTICNKISRNQVDDDVSRTVQLFRKMKEADPFFQWSVQLGPNSTIESLMWCSGRSIQQYACFGDVVTFDTTYCTNFYKMPFGLFVGVNHHFQTIIFAGVLIKHETTESFKWVFTEFLKLMRGPAPQTVLTDQCKAMTIALSETWLDTFHLWCKWHVFKNIREHLGPIYTKNLEFRHQFYSIVNEMLTKEEFVEAWKELCDKFKLNDNPFMIRAFQCRSKWAKPYVKDNFCAGMTSTQRSECANMMLKKFVPRNSSFHHFVSQYNMLLQDRDMEEGRQEDQTKQFLSKYTRMWPVESHAKRIYTKATFLLFRKQVEKASSWKVTGQARDYYVVSHHRPSEKPSWYKKEYKVFLIDGGARYFCECGFFEHVGILCCHTLRLMIRLDIEHIPDAHILTRWTRGAKCNFEDQMDALHPKHPDLAPLSVWQTQLNFQALDVVTKGNTNRETIAAVMKHLKAASKEVDDILRSATNSVVYPNSEPNLLDTETDVDDISVNRYGASGSSAGLSDTEILNMKAPPVVRSRGAPRFKRFRSGAEKAMKKGSKSASSTKPTSKEHEEPKGSTEADRNEAELSSLLKRKYLEKNNGLPVQTSFCSKCRKPGHNRNKCSTDSTPPLKKARNSKSASCSKCGLKGHTDEECLVADVENDSFFT